MAKPKCKQQDDSKVVSTAKWLVTPSLWSMTQGIIATGVSFLAVAVLLLYLNNWRQSSFCDALASLGYVVILLGVLLCVVRRYKHE